MNLAQLNFILAKYGCANGYRAYPAAAACIRCGGGNEGPKLNGLLGT
ncbi:MAG: hypothetical protein GY750_13675 [Lentisphaerae bacterium]|nr:hypothetical protein [Lentisphaerota bacterium]MCP4102452.1 hypothetical protein [Lentisphaerota bacterium]